MTQPLDPTLIALAHGCFINQPHQRLLELREQLADAALAWYRATKKVERLLDSGGHDVAIEEAAEERELAEQSAFDLAAKIFDLAAKIEAAQ